MDIPISLFSFALIASFTPGPNNILVMSQSMNYGLRSTTGYQLGAGTACFVILLLALLLGNVVEKVLPSLVPVMTYVGCAYMLYLAWVVARSKPHDVDSPHKQAHFWLGFGLQFVNPKYYLYVLTLVAVLIPVMHSLAQMTLYAVFFRLLLWGGCSHGLCAEPCCKVFCIPTIRLLTLRWLRPWCIALCHYFCRGGQTGSGFSFTWIQGMC